MMAGLLTMERVCGDMIRRSLPSMRGDLRAAQSAKWALYSSSVMPPWPTSSMSRSLHPPGILRSAKGATLLRMNKTEQWVPGAMQNGSAGLLVSQAQRASGREKES